MGRDPRRGAEGEGASSTSTPTATAAASSAPRAAIRCSTGQRGRRRREGSADRRLGRASARAASVEVRAHAPTPATARRTRPSAAPTGKDLPLGPLGSGSDYSAFLQHLGLAALNVGYGGEGESGGVYHSLYDNYRAPQPLRRPGLRLWRALAKTVRAAGAAPRRRRLTRCSAMATSPTPWRLSGRGEEARRRPKREEAATRHKLLAADAYKLATDPTKTWRPPAAGAAVAGHRLRAAGRRRRQAEDQRRPPRRRAAAAQASLGPARRAEARRASCAAGAAPAARRGPARPALVQEHGLRARPASPATAPRPCRACARRSRSGASTTPMSMRGGSPRCSTLIRRGSMRPGLPSNADPST